MQGDAAGPAARDSLDWLSTEKLLELISHDINNLCHGALSYIDLALDPKVPPEARQRFLLTAKTLTHRASRFTPHLKHLNALRAADLAGSASDEVRKAAQDARERACELNFGAALELALEGDALTARTVGGPFLTVALTHLFDNAIRHGHAGRPARVTLRATRDGPLVRLEALDDGKGFQHGTDVTAARRFATPGSVSGAGLGLATVRLLAERAGGSFEIAKAAKPGASGAKVTLSLPAAGQ